MSCTGITEKVMNGPQLLWDGSHVINKMVHGWLQPGQLRVMGRVTNVIDGS